MPGGNANKLRDWDSADEIVAVEQEIIRRQNLKYIYCEVPATALSTTYQLESAGYRFSEFRIHSTLNTDDTEIFTRHLYPNEASLIGDEEDLEKTAVCERGTTEVYLAADGFTSKSGSLSHTNIKMQNPMCFKAIYKMCTIFI